MAISNGVKNPYKLIESEIIDLKDETANIKTFVLKPKEKVSFKTGQFMEVAIPGFGEAPFTPSSNPKDTDKLEFTIMETGRITKALHKMKTGEKVGIRGPYGLGYPVEDFKNKEVLIVGGGVGLAPIRSLLYALFNEMDNYKKVDLKYGAKTPNDIIYKNEVGQWDKKDKTSVVTTVDIGDKTWKGNVGLVTTIMDKIKMNFKEAVAVVCGPPIMMKFATFKLIEEGFLESQIYLSMEKNMSCGIGKCGHCRLGEYYACKDGPVFRYDKIKEIPNIWD